MITAHSLPSSSTRFIGRRDELDRICQLFADPTCRLLTLVGPGGIGKTRLALEAVQHLTFPDGVHFIPFQPLISPDFMVSAVADAIGFQFYQGGSPKQQLLDYFQTRSLLLLMDNVEHLLDGVQLLSDILSAAGAVCILATSRERLNLQEEWVLDVDGLSYPANDAETEIDHYSAVELFIQRAQRVRAGFALKQEHKHAISRICRLTGGMPLAIELAAAWIRALSCEEIAYELERSLDILETPARNVPERHRNMRAAFDPTWNRLMEDEQSVFKRLSVFRGGFTREAAEQVAAATLTILAALVDKSLLRVSADGRYDLHELLRQYSEERRNEVPDEAEYIRDDHCRYYARFMEKQWPRLKGSEIKSALQDISTELDNVRAAWDWAVSHHMAVEIEAAMVSLWFYYGVGVRYQEGVQMFASATPAFRHDTAMYARLMARWGELSNVAGLMNQGQKLLEESIILLRQVNARYDLAFALFRLTQLGCPPISVSIATEYLEESLAIYTELDDHFGIGEVLLLWGRFYYDQYLEHRLDEALQQAHQYVQESLAVFKQYGSSFGTAVAHTILGWVAHLLGDSHLCWQYNQMSLEFYQELGIGFAIRWSLRNMSYAACALGAYAEARRYVLEILMSDSRVRFYASVWTLDVVCIAAAILLGGGAKERAYELLGVIDREQPNFAGPRDPLLRLLDEELPPHLAAAVERGRAQPLDTVMQELFADFSASVESAAPLPSLAPQPPRETLSARELEILGLLADGLSNREIAGQLVFSVNTVKWYLNQIYTKLHVNSRTQAVARARALGLLPLL